MSHTIGNFRLQGELAARRQRERRRELAGVRAGFRETVATVREFAFWVIVATGAAFYVDLLLRVVFE